MFRVERLRSAGLLCLTFLVFCPVTPSLAQTRDPKLDDLAARLASQFSTQLFPRTEKLRVIVLDFRNTDEGVTRLGVHLADEFALAFREKATDLTVLDRPIVRSAMNEDCFRAFFARPDEGEGRFVKQLGAHAMVRGKIISHQDELDLQVGLITVGGTRLAEAEQHLLWSDERRTLELQPRYAAPTAAPADSPWPGIPASTEKGYSEPRCISCPNPPYSEDARKARLQGTILLNLLIGADGSVRDVRVGGGLTCGMTPDMTAEAIQTVKKWKFVPVLGPDGKPATVQLKIEVNFRLI